MADKNMKGPRQKKTLRIATSIEKAKEIRAEINRLNRQRARTMETRIARYLRGMRTLLSGAHKRYKGDCEVYIDLERKYLVECKSSAAMHKIQPVLKLNSAWFPKLQQEAEAMNAVFGVLIIHYHNQKMDYVFISRSDLLYVLRNVNNTLREIYTTLVEKTTESRKTLIRMLSGKFVKIYNLEMRKIVFEKHAGLSLMCIEQYDTDYFILPINEFRDLIDAMRAYLLGG